MSNLTFYSEKILKLLIILSYAIKSCSPSIIPGPIPYTAGSECSCGLFEFPWVFCFIQYFDCNEYCTTGKDIDNFDCRIGSSCSWSTGDGKGRCFCPYKCSDEEQREESLRNKFISICPKHPTAFAFVGPCADLNDGDISNYIDEYNLYSGWECGVLGNGNESNGTIYQFFPNGYSSSSVDLLSLKTFNGTDNVTYTSSLTQKCHDSAVYTGDRSYEFNVDDCFVCIKQIPILPFPESESNCTLGDDSCS